jgi:hypothetical protein
MRKIFLIMIVVLTATYNTTAQNFLNDINYSINAGLSLSECDKVFTEAKMGLTVGADVAKPFLYLGDGRHKFYGQVGVHFAKWGGNEPGTFFESDRSAMAYHFTIPMCAGYQFKFGGKWSLYTELGPFISFKGNEGEFNENNYVECKSTMFGLAFNVGIRYKRFSFAYINNLGISDFAKYAPGWEKAQSLKSKSVTVNLRYTFGSI